MQERKIYKRSKLFSQNDIQLSVAHSQYYLSGAIKDELVSFFAFLAARFSFNESAGFFTASFLLFRSLDMVVLQMGEACIYLHNWPSTLLQTYKNVLIINRTEAVKSE